MRKRANVGRRRRTHEEFVDILNKEYPIYKILEKYTNSNEDVDFKCLVCNQTFTKKPRKLLEGRGCPYCANNSKVSICQFKKEVAKKGNGEYILLSSKYTSSIEKYNFKHLSCDTEFETSRHGFVYSGTRCPRCNSMSKGETIIFEYLKSKGLLFTKEKSFNDLIYIKKLRFDFYFEIGENKIVIEFDGEQHLKKIK